MERFRISISAKLACYLTLCMIVIFGVIGIFNLKMYRRHLMAGVYQNAGQISDIIKRSTNFSMLRNERQSIYRIIQDIAQEPGIQKIRIYNKEGIITFSTEPDEVNTEVNVRAEACVVCHSGPMPSGDVPIFQRARNYLNSDGQHVLGVISPIKSERTCVVADCHAHDADQEVLGVLDVIMQLDNVDASQQEYEKRLMWFVIFAMVVICLISSVVVYIMVFRPVNKIVEGTRRIAGGELDYRININSRDEMGGLADAFNNMAEDLKNYQIELLTAKAYTDNIIRSMSNSLVVVNPGAIIKKVNKATCDLLEYTQHELIGKPLSLIFAEGHFEDIQLGELPISDFNKTVETNYLSRQGKKIHVLFSGSAVRGEQGEFQGVVCMAQDITWQTEAMHAGHLASLGELAAGVAHEINNPMNSIINFAQILIDGIPKGEKVDEKILETIIKEGDRVSSIVKSLLSFAREQDRVKRPVRIHKVLQETLSLTEIQLVKDGIILEVDVPETLPFIVGDFQQIQQVFINIINNARYALNERYPQTHPGKKFFISGTVGTLNGEPAVQMNFHDTGIGIPKEIIEKVEEPFLTTKPAGQGTGLGLAISHGIIGDHGGTLTIESVEGKFTQIIIALPIYEEER